MHFLFAFFICDKKTKNLWGNFWVAAEHKFSMASLKRLYWLVNAKDLIIFGDEKKKTSPSRIQSFSPSGCYAILGEGNDWGILFELGGIFFLGWGIFFGTRKYYSCERFAICSHYFIILRGRCRFGFGFALTDTDSFEKAASQYRKVVRVRWAKFVPLFWL